MLVGLSSNEQEPFDPAVHFCFSGFWTRFLNPAFGHSLTDLSAQLYDCLS